MNAAKQPMLKFSQERLNCDALFFAHDVLFRVEAENWQRLGREFAGLLFGAQLGGTIGQYVEDLGLIAQASEASEWSNVVQFLPFRRR